MEMYNGGIFNCKLSILCCILVDGGLVKTVLRVKC